MNRIFSLGLCTVVTIFSLSARGAELKSQPNQSSNVSGRDAVVSTQASIPDVFNRIAVGYFDGNGMAGAAMSFPALGIWKYGAGAWSQISSDCAEELVAFDPDGDRMDGIIGDFGQDGLWMWQGGAWTQLSPDDAEYIVADEIDFDGKDELFCDFGALGLWYFNDGAWSQLNSANPDYFAVQRDTDFEHSAVNYLHADFGAAGMWWRFMFTAHYGASNHWHQLSELNPDFLICPDFSWNFVYADFGALGIWAFHDSWEQLSGVGPEFMLHDPFLGDFGSSGLWLLSGSGWTELSGADAEYMISAQVDGDSAAEAFVTSAHSGYGNMTAAYGFNSAGQTRKTWSPETSTATPRERSWSTSGRSACGSGTAESGTRSARKIRTRVDRR